MKRIGVLGLQGAVREHLDKLHEIEEVDPFVLRYKEDLKQADAIIIPGGESTAMGRLLREFDLLEPLKERIAGGLPVWGTCAGMILLAKYITNDDRRHLEVMDIKVRRNAYGTQVDSFTASAVIETVSPKEIPLVFIRAPFIEGVGEKVETLLKLGGNIVACREGNMLVTSFHPELTKDLSFHRYFAGFGTV